MTDRSGDALVRIQPRCLAGCGDQLPSRLAVAEPAAPLPGLHVQRSGLIDADHPLILRWVIVEIEDADFLGCEVWILAGFLGSLRLRRYLREVADLATGGQAELTRRTAAPWWGPCREPRLGERVDHLPYLPCRRRNQDRASCPPRPQSGQTPGEPHILTSFRAALTPVHAQASSVYPRPLTSIGEPRNHQPQDPHRTGYHYPSMRHRSEAGRLGTCWGTCSFRCRSRTCTRCHSVELSRAYGFAKGSLLGRIRLRSQAVFGGIHLERNILLTSSYRVCIPDLLVPVT